MKDIQVRVEVQNLDDSQETWVPPKRPPQHTPARPQAYSADTNAKPEGSDPSFRADHQGSPASGDTPVADFISARPASILTMLILLVCMLTGGYATYHNLGLAGTYEYKAEMAEIAALTGQAVLMGAPDGQNSAGGTGHRLASADILVSEAAGGLWVPALVALLVWKYRVCRNLPSLDPGKNGGSTWKDAKVWVIPFLKLYMPVMTMSQIAKTSDPRNLGAERETQKSRTPVLALWWLSLIAGAALLPISMYRMDNAAGATGTLSAIRLSLSSHIALVFAAGLTILIVWIVTADQQRRRDAVRIAAALGE